MSTVSPAPTPTTDLEKAQHAEILELESQIRLLNTKVSSTVDHAADLQDEVRSLRIQLRQREDLSREQEGSGESSIRRMSTYFTMRRPSAPSSGSASHAGPAAAGSSAIAGSSAAAGSSSSSSAAAGVAGSGGGGGGVPGQSGLRQKVSGVGDAYSGGGDEDVSVLLQRERKARVEAETKYRALQEESETLSQSLFEEANRMVAVERKALHLANTKLRAAQEREEGRRQRLGELEKAVGTIQRVRGVLANRQNSPVPSA